MEGRANAMQSAESLLAIAQAHRVPGTEVDATDAADTTDALLHLTAEARDGGGPRFLDAQAGQWPGNTTFFPHGTGATDLADARRPVDDQWRAHDDPVLNEIRRLLAAGLPLDALAAVDRDVVQEVTEAVAAALAAPAPEPDLALRDVVAP
jgi:pyruvate dehydrogenase E1 component alpha subunit